MVITGLRTYLVYKASPSPVLQYATTYTMLIYLGIGSGQRQLIAVTCIAEHA